MGIKDAFGRPKNITDTKHGHAELLIPQSRFLVSTGNKGLANVLKYSVPVLAPPPPPLVHLAFLRLLRLGWRTQPFLFFATKRLLNRVI